MLCRRCNHDLPQDGVCPVCYWQTGWRKAMPRLEHTFEHNEAEPENNSGTGEPAPTRMRMMGFCWPAYMHPILFLVVNRIPFLRFFPGWVLLTDWWTGYHGYELAWMYRRFDSYEQFRATMAAWNRWARAEIVTWAVGLVLGGAWLLGRWALGR